jgi:hypothetical protein
MLEWGDAMSSKSNSAVATMGIDIGKNSFHVIALDQRGAIVLRQKWSRSQLEARLSNLPPCLIGMGHPATAPDNKVMNWRPHRLFPVSPCDPCS